jgi:hypothetical protein
MVDECNSVENSTQGEWQIYFCTSGNLIETEVAMVLAAGNYNASMFDMNSKVGQLDHLTLK